jgi:Domain of unknown function (DUF1839)
MSGQGNGFVSLLGLDPAAYRPHLLHGAERSYTETNCYTDILIEFLHARGNEPLAMMGCVLRVDFEGDPSTSYRREHVKSSVVAEAIDRDDERLRYFHGPGYYELQGEDYRGVFRLGRRFSEDVLPPYTEIVRLDAGPPLAGSELRAIARELLVTHLARRPEPNPFLRFGAQLAVDLPRLLEGDHAAYHDYAFATVRMVGSAFEVGASHVEWLLGEAGGPAVSAMGRIVEGCKILSFKLARRRAFDPDPAIAELALAWDETFAGLERALV